MTALLATVLALAAVLLLRPPGGAPGRFRRAVGREVRGFATPSITRSATGKPGRGHSGSGGPHVGRLGTGKARGGGTAKGWPGPAGHWPGRERESLCLTLVVQQLAALLKGGRTPARLWDELWLVHGGRPEPASTAPLAGPPGRDPFSATPERIFARAETSRASAERRPGLSTGSLIMLGAGRSAALRGSPVSEAIRKSARASFPRTGSREARVWFELAACFDIAEASGCPLADVLARFAAQLEAEDDAEAARQTALAGPKATVTLLSWLPLMGLGLGVALGVDPWAILIGTPMGMAALAAGVVLTAAGRFWSARLVRAAAGGGVP